MARLRGSFFRGITVPQGFFHGGIALLERLYILCPSRSGLRPPLLPAVGYLRVFSRPFSLSAAIQTGKHPFLYSLFALSFLLLFFVSISPVLAASEMPQNEPVVERRPFRGVVRRDMAERTAKLAAELALYEQASRLLAKEPDLHFVNDAGGAPFPIDGLARLIFSTRLEAVGVEGFPPHMQAVVSLSLVPPDNIRNAVRETLPRLDLMEIYAQALATQRSLLMRYDALATQLLPLNPVTDGGKEEIHKLQNIMHEMAAMETYFEVLPQYSHNWAAPQEARLKLAAAEKLAPNNPLILTAMAEIYLQLDRPVSSLEYIGRVLQLAPEFARAHDVKGAALLRQRLPALAAESFGRAIALSPKNSVYYMHRASAYLVQEEQHAMCGDFQSACSLGDCEGLQWARSIGTCPAGPQ